MLDKILKYLKRTLKIIAVLILIFSIAFYFLAPYAIVKIIALSQKEINSITYKKNSPKDYNYIYQNISFRSFDSSKMQAYYLQSPKYSKLTIIMLHGIRACKETMLPSSQSFVNHGYNVVLLDLRAHGQSEGKYCTYGDREKRDISKLIDKLLEIDSNQNFAIYAHSLGGAIALQSMEFDKRIKCGIIESTFKDLNSVVFAYMNRILYYVPKILSDHLLQKAGNIAEFDPNKIKISKSAKNINQAVFIAHGSEDKNINISNSYSIFNNLASNNKELYIVQGANHFNIHYFEGKKYMDKIFNFLENNFVVSK